MEPLRLDAICRRAGVSRGSFYKHYDGPFGLLAEIQDELFETIWHSIDESLGAMRTKYGIDDRRISLVYSFASSGIAGIVQSWISGILRMTPREVAEFVDRIMMSGINGLARGSRMPHSAG